MKHDSDILKRIKNYFMRRKSAREARAFESEIEKDPFLYEAMEGYEDMLASEIQQALDELDDRLDENQSKQLFATWWKAAAAVVVIIIAASVAFSIREDAPEAESPAVSNEENSYQPRKNEPSFDVYTEGDSTDAIASEDAGEQSDYPIDQEIAASEMEVKRVPDVKLEEAKPKEKEAVVATIEKNNSTPDSSKEDDAIAALDDSEDAAIALDEPAQARSMQALPASKAETTSAEEISGASPTGGMEAYQKYLKANLNRSSGMPSGKVSVSFTFDRSGKPKDIKIDNSLCTACDAEAKRLIENGPAWQNTDKKERMSIQVEFP